MGIINKTGGFMRNKNIYKKQGAMGLIIGIIAVIALAIFLIVPSYNNLVGEKENVDQAYAQVENVVQRRADLIPNLVSTVKGYAKHEEDTFTQVTQARSGIDNAKSPKELADANQELSNAITNINAVAEAYPELKADKQFTQLMDELAGSENRISVERKNYNEAVQKFNTKIKRFPTSLIAKITGFESAEYFKASEGAKEAPKVNFGS